MKYQPDEIWDAATWAEIDQAVAEEVKRVGVARRVFRTEPVMAADGTAPSWISGAAIGTRGEGPERLFIPEGDAHPFLEISVGFSLTGAQVENEAFLHAGRTLARRAATQLAQAEDVLVLTGTKAEWEDRVKAVAASATVTGREHVTGRDGVASFDERDDSKQVTVKLKLPEKRAGSELSASPSETAEEGCAKPKCCCTGPSPATQLLNGIADVASQLAAQGWPEPYALILGSTLYAHSYSQLVAGSAETPNDRLASHTRHILVSSALNPAHGVVVSLAGDATTIFIAREAAVAFVTEELDGEGVHYHFRVFERVQYAVRDRTSIGLLLSPAQPPPAA